MKKINVEIVEKLPNEKFIVKVENRVLNAETNEINNVIKFGIADKSCLINLHDLSGNLIGFQFFDNYKVDENGEIIIYIKKSGKEYYENVLTKFDLSDTQTKKIEVSGGPFNVGPYAKQYYEFIEPSKSVDDVISEKFNYNYGFINKNGEVVVYPSYDYIEFGNENTCIVGKLIYEGIMYGYVDTTNGKFITPICFRSAGKFYDNRAAVKYNGKYGYIDRKKIIVNPDNKDEYAEKLYPMFFKAKDFKDGKAIVGFSKATHLTQARYAIVSETGIESIILEKTLRKMKKNINM